MVSAYNKIVKIVNFLVLTILNFYLHSPIKPGFYFVPDTLVPTDPYISDELNYYIEKINLDKAWDICHWADNELTIGVFDTGIKGPSDNEIFPNLNVSLNRSYIPGTDYFYTT